MSFKFNELNSVCIKKSRRQPETANAQNNQPYSPQVSNQIQ